MWSVDEGGVDSVECGVGEALVAVVQTATGAAVGTAVPEAVFLLAAVSSSESRRALTTRLKKVQ